MSTASWGGCGRDQRRDEGFGEVEGRLQDEEESEHQVRDQSEQPELLHLPQVDSGEADHGQNGHAEAEDVHRDPHLGGE
jgi:hypothetical protein